MAKKRFIKCLVVDLILTVLGFCVFYCSKAWIDFPDIGPDNPLVRAGAGFGVFCIGLGYMIGDFLLYFRGRNASAPSEEVAE